ncbi:hypothetical protein V1277_006569 [Bradyrhizobium sp. AZCC 1588]|uniref:hypothetical protein n=1 Tax=unclassified Bradyrhizobium TaxID=2631580 RepID=UPI002FEF6C5B
MTQGLGRRLQAAVGGFFIGWPLSGPRPIAAELHARLNIESAHQAARLLPAAIFFLSERQLRPYLARQNASLRQRMQNLNDVRRTAFGRFFYFASSASGMHCNM